MQKNKNKLRVLLVSPYSEKKVGGIGTWSKNIIDFSRDNNDYDLIFQNTASILKSNLVINKRTRIISGIADTTIILLKLFYNLLFKNPDVVHYTSSASLALLKDRFAIFITRKIFRRKFIIHWHFGRIPELCGLKNKEYKNLINVINLANHSIVIDISSYNALKELRIKNVSFVPNPISETLRKHSEKLPINTIQKNREVGTVLFVGHIVEAKGVFELVKVCMKISNVKKLVFIGPCLDEVKTKIQDIASDRNNNSDWLEFAGELKREEVFSYYINCNVFCLPSYTEGFPNVILESMAFACPIIATNVGAIPEMLSDGCGICIDAKDEVQLYDALMKSFSDRKGVLDMGINARYKVLNNFTVEKVLNTYLKIWES